MFSVKQYHKSEFLFSLLIALFCLSCNTPCDQPIENPFVKNNVAWSTNRNEDYQYKFDGWYLETEGGAFAILHWKGKKQLSGQAKNILLCLDKEKEAPMKYFNLSTGVFIGSDRGSINLIQSLDNKAFSGKQKSKNSIELSYNGQVKIIDDLPVLFTFIPDWLRFSVKASKNRKKTESLIEKLIPELKKRQEAENILKCLSTFMQSDFPRADCWRFIRLFSGAYSTD